MTDKLQNPSTARKTYLAILNLLLYNKKISAIPPLLVDGKFVSDFCEKANVFNNFFINVYTNTKCKYFTTFFILDKCLFSWDNISIKMIKICGESITVPLKIIFEQSLKESKLPELWKKANIVPVHKKEDKNVIKNYRPVSLLPIFSKIYERVTYNALFNYFKSNKLFTSS